MYHTTGGESRRSALLTCLRCFPPLIQLRVGSLRLPARRNRRPSRGTRAPRACAPAARRMGEGGGSGRRAGGELGELSFDQLFLGELAAHGFGELGAEFDFAGELVLADAGAQVVEELGGVELG